jgi:hypothetical protein
MRARSVIGDAAPNRRLGKQRVQRVTTSEAAVAALGFDTLLLLPVLVLNFNVHQTRDYTFNGRLLFSSASRLFIPVASLRFFSQVRV